MILELESLFLSHIGYELQFLFQKIFGLEYPHDFQVTVTTKIFFGSLPERILLSV